MLFSGSKSGSHVKLLCAGGPGFRTRGKAFGHEKKSFQYLKMLWNSTTRQDSSPGLRVREFDTGFLSKTEMCHTFSAQFFKALTLTLKGYTVHMQHMIFCHSQKFNGRKDAGHMKELKTALMGERCDGDTIGPQHRMFHILAPSCFLSRLEIPQIALRKGEILKGIKDGLRFEKRIYSFIIFMCI